MMTKVSKCIQCMYVSNKLGDICEHVGVSYDVCIYVILVRCGHWA